jgi:GcrA cell cycle regulator
MMQKNQIIDWTDERVAELRELAQTMTAAQIALKWDVTRNTVIGKMSRLGIVGAGGAAIRHPRVPKPARVKLIKLPLAPCQIPHQAPTKAARKSSGKPVDFWHLTGRTCRWPLWRGDEPIGDKFYCGGLAVEGIPYCDCHARTAFSGWVA